MAAEGDHDIRRYTYTGDPRVPDDFTHVIIDESVRVIPESAFSLNFNLVEVIMHQNVKIVEDSAFDCCPNLRRVFMPGVEIVEDSAFAGCEGLAYVECGKLERIGNGAFGQCLSLGSINLPSANNVEGWAFEGCEALTDVTFGSKLESIKRCAFYHCCSLERFTIPLKDGIITHVRIFKWCENLKHVDLVEGELHETVAALQLEEWRNDMNEEIVSINQILPAREEAARAIRTWIRSVLRKVIHYKAEHQRLLNEQVATALEHSLPQDIVMNNVLPFLELPSYTFEVGDHEEGEEQDYFDSEEEDDEE